MSSQQAGSREFPVVLTTEEAGGFVAKCLTIPGCISQGDTKEEALDNIRDAIKVCLANQPDEDWASSRRRRADHGGCLGLKTTPHGTK